MYLGGVGAYYMKDGQPVSTLYVGDVMTFNVPGFSQVWLDQYQNGNLQFSGPFNLPMAPYTLLARDAGTFTASVFKLSTSGKRGDSIGTDMITVLAQKPAAPLAVPQGVSVGPPIITGTQAPAYQAGGYPIQEIVTPFTPIPTGVPTPSAPIPINYTDTSTSPPTDATSGTQQAGFDPWMIALLLGAGLFFVFGGRRK